MVGDKNRFRFLMLVLLSKKSHQWIDLIIWCPHRNRKEEEKKTFQIDSVLCHLHFSYPTHDARARDCYEINRFRCYTEKENPLTRKLIFCRQLVISIFIFEIYSSIISETIFPKLNEKCVSQNDFFSRLLVSHAAPSIRLQNHKWISWQHIRWRLFFLHTQTMRVKEKEREKNTPKKKRN